MWNSFNAMKLQITIPPNTHILRLAGDLDLYSVAEARQALLDFMADQPAIELDLHGLETCDTAGLQLLLAAHRHAGAAGKAFSIQMPAPAIGQCADALGLPPASRPAHTR
jgi:anti-anti-sigma factor